MVPCACAAPTRVNPKRVGAITFDLVARNRYFRVDRAIGDRKRQRKKAQIEIDLIAKFGSERLESIDKFEPQTHVNYLAKTYSQDRVKQARSYLRSIFDEAIEPEFLVKDPTRKLRIPKNLRPKNKQILTWEQLRAVLAKATRRDRLLLMLEMTDALRPSELFAIRWRTFDGENTLDLTETVFRGEIRSFGKTSRSLGKMHPPDDLATELRHCKLRCPDPSPEAFMFPNSDGGLMDTANYRTQGLKPLAEALGIPKLNFQVIRRALVSQPTSTCRSCLKTFQQMVGTVHAMLTRNVGSD